MTIVRTIECDGCGKQEPAQGFEGKWLNVQTQVSTHDELMENIRRVAEGESFHAVADWGDFCSLVCLANWASAQASLRELEAE